MKRFVSACLILAFVWLAVGVSSADAASIRIKLKGKALNDYSGASWAIINGLGVVGKGGKVLAIVDSAGTGISGTATWSLTVPSGSSATLDSTSSFGTSFTADTVGFYYLQLTYGSSTVVDTIFASTYVGVSDVSGCSCHNGAYQPSLTTNFTTWSATGHAQIFKQGVTGNLEVSADPSTGTEYGAYAPTCIKCHAVGFDASLNNNNFGYSVHASGWDTTWYKSLPYASGDYWTTTGDTTAYTLLTTQQKALGTIGCESCHGPLGGHTGAFMGQMNTVAASRRMETYQADLCNQCHNGSGRHSIGSYYNKSAHAAVPSEQRNSCAPCHQGYSFVKWINSGHDTTGWASTLTAQQLATPISCVACHDPHKAATINSDGTLDPGLRAAAVDSLRNGYQFTPVGTSQVCSYCHSSRYSVKAKVKTTAPYYGFGARFGPHENPQYDMFVGSNGYQFGDTTFTGVNTHMGLENGCVTCHMQDRTRSGNTLSNHSMMMSGDTSYSFNPVSVCKNCHGEISDYNEIQAAYDYDRNGKIEGVQTEIQGLLTQLAAILPKDSTGSVIGSGSLSASDSAAVYGKPDVVAGIWNYRFVVADGSLGVHNAKYAVRLLYKSLGWTPLWVKTITGTTPSAYALNQNYPNPFNPSTTIRFQLPQEQKVKLQIFDITGALVKTLLQEAISAGTKEVVWDGTNQTGVKVASGMYLYRLEAGSFVATKKLVLLK